MASSRLNRQEISNLLRISDPYLLLHSFEIDTSSSHQAITYSSLHSVFDILSSHFINQPTLPASISQEIMLQSLACLINYSTNSGSSLAIIVAFNTRVILPVNDLQPSLMCRVSYQSSDSNFIKGKAILLHDSSVVATSSCSYSIKTTF